MDNYDSGWSIETKLHGRLFCENSQDKLTGESNKNSWVDFFVRYNEISIRNLHPKKN